jgi:2-polyprenyl-6-methoxyphenol hydroxylase-like FAD-dependent oxidoreductase
MFGIPEIAIIGAGPSGLTLGALLAKRGVPFTIYENRARPTEADLDAVSGMLDMHDESGLAAIRACGLYDDFLPLTAGGGDGDRILDLNGDVRYCGPTGEWRPEIARNDLTRLVLSRVPEGMIRWGRKLRSAREAGDGTVVLNFEDEDPVVVDLVVGADGAWSKVRRELIPDAGTPRYTGVQDLAVAATQFGTRYPALDDMIGKGNMFALGLGNQCGGHRGSHDSCLLHMSVQAEEEDFVRVRGLEGKTAAEVATAFLEDEKLFGQWGERMKELMRTVCDEDTKAHPGRVAEIRGVCKLLIYIPPFTSS